MPYNSEIHHRRTTRLTGYDYTQSGGYFITIVTAARQSIFGEIRDAIFLPSALGLVAQAQWERMPSRFPGLIVDAFVVMPNHIHGIFVIASRIDEGQGNPQAADQPADNFRSSQSQRPIVNVSPGSLGAVVRAYKSSVAFACRKIQGMAESHIWQRNYHDRIIRNQDEMDRIRLYILNNPQQWSLDQENPHRER